LSSKALTFRSCDFIGEICGEHFGELRASYCEVREWIVLMMCLGSTFEMILPGLTWRRRWRRWRMVEVEEVEDGGGGWWRRAAGWHYLE